MDDQIILFCLLAVVFGLLIWGKIRYDLVAFGAMQWAALLPLIVALSDAFRDLITRTLTRDESSLRIIFTTAVILALGGGVTVVAGWDPVRSVDVIWFCCSAVSFVVAHYFMVEAFRHAQVVVVAPFRYFLIVWAIISGYVFWGEIPDDAVYIGVAVVIAAGTRNRK